MTRDELLTALTVERFSPQIEPKTPPKRATEQADWDDSETTTARRRRLLDDATTHVERRTA